MAIQNNGKYHEENTCNKNVFVYSLVHLKRYIAESCRRPCILCTSYIFKLDFFPCSYE